MEGFFGLSPPRNNEAQAQGETPAFVQAIFHAFGIGGQVEVLQYVGATIEAQAQGTSQSLTVQCDELRAANVQITSRPYPGFSTDWGPMMQVLMTQLPGTSTFHETIFSQRFAHISEFVRMGATIEPLDLPFDEKVYNFEQTAGLSHAVQIQGVSKLHAAIVNANDVRAGAALVLAGLIASGSTEVTGIEQIERGYEAFTERLGLLGASIKRV